MDLIGAAGWAAFKQAINDAHDTFNQVTVTWKQSVGGIDRNQEDNNTEVFNSIPLLCLLYYNEMRTWPISTFTESGELDKESIVIYLNIKYLKTNNWLDSKGNFIYQPDTDRIIHKGVKYKSSGITRLAQAQDEDLLIQIILKPEVVPTQTDLDAN